MKIMDQWLATWIIFAPIIGIVLLLFVPKHQSTIHRMIGIAATVPSLCLAIYMYAQFNQSVGDLQWAQLIDWFQIPLGLGNAWEFSYHVGVDGLSVAFVLLTCMISTFAAFASIAIKEKTKGYYLLFLLLMIGMLGVFLSANLFLFFIFFELTIVTTYFLIGSWGYFRKERAANYFLIYNGLGSGFLLFGVVGIFVACQTLDFPLIQERISLVLAENEVFLRTVFYALLLAFSIKLPVFPFHSWMLRVHVEANPAVVMIHSGILLKMGAYGLLRLGVGWFPDLMKEMAFIIAILGSINLFYGAILAMVQKELKRVLAYASISHMGIFLLGLASLNTIGLQGALFQAISHGLISSLLFFLVGSLYERTKTTELQDLGGITRTMPLFSGFLILAGFALLGLPGLSGFISEFFALLGLFHQHPILAGVGAIGLIFAATYTLRAILTILWGVVGQRVQQVSDLRKMEWIPMVVIVCLIVGIGVYPDVLGQPMKLAIESIALRIGG